MTFNTTKYEVLQITLNNKPIQALATTSITTNFFV